MKLIALLSWFNEPPELLEECVQSLAGVADYLVAVDGAYTLWPSSRRTSSLPEEKAVRGAAARAKLPLMLYRWRGTGNEVEKRTAMFQHGNTVAVPGWDWFLVIDADERIEDVDKSLKSELSKCQEDVAEFMLCGWNRIDQNRMRGLFRAHPDLHVEKAHYRYMVGDRVLWGHPEVDQQETAFDATSLLRILHQRHRRPEARLQAAHRYYEARDMQQVERMSWSHAL